VYTNTQKRHFARLCTSSVGEYKIRKIAKKISRKFTGGKQYSLWSLVIRYSYTI